MWCLTTLSLATTNTYLTYTAKCKIHLTLRKRLSIELGLYYFGGCLDTRDAEEVCMPAWGIVICTVSMAEWQKQGKADSGKVVDCSEGD